ncbi:MAG TPA: polysaccharide deacetylase family protein [Capillimicrobium sp.]|nr:polysaccharide deacetylase family protein [Capillimicrobium sp.]
MSVTMGLMPRDLVGYAGAPPDVTWPGGARLAVNVVLNYEEGSERNPLDGDVEREPLVEARYDVPRGERELFTESTFEYGSRVGIWRTLETLDRHGVTPTVFGCALALERNPAVTRALVERGCDFVGHGYRWIPHTGMARDVEREQIRRCVDVLRRLTGQPIRGWFTRPPNTVNTRELLAQEGLLYDCGSVSDDLPYWDRVGDRPFLVIPYTLDVNDTKFVKSQFFTADDFATYVIDAFDALLAESVRTPRMLSIGLHPRIIGRPARIAGLERVLAHITRRPGVWLCGREEIASFWTETFPQPDAWNLAPAEAAP